MRNSIDLIFIDSDNYRHRDQYYHLYSFSGKQEQYHIAEGEMKKSVKRI